VHLPSAEIEALKEYTRARDVKIGLCPGQDSSGKTKQMLGLTKAGNCRVRALLCESAKAIKRTNPYGEKSKRILERQKNASLEVIAYADKATRRIQTKMKKFCELPRIRQKELLAGH
jgi:transposase